MKESSRHLIRGGGGGGGGGGFGVWGGGGVRGVGWCGGGGCFSWGGENVSLWRGRGILLPEEKTPLRKGLQRHRRSGREFTTGLKEGHREGASSVLVRESNSVKKGEPKPQFLKGPEGKGSRSLEKKRLTQCTEKPSRKENNFL